MQCSCQRENAPKSVFSEFEILRSLKQNFFSEEFSKELQHEFCTKVNPQLQKALYVTYPVEYTHKTSFLLIFLSTWTVALKTTSHSPFLSCYQSDFNHQQALLLTFAQNQCHAWWHWHEDLQGNHRSLIITHFTQFWWCSKGRVWHKQQDQVSSGGHWGAQRAWHRQGTELPRADISALAFYKHAPFPSPGCPAVSWALLFLSSLGFKHRWHHQFLFFIQQWWKSWWFLSPE